MKILKSFSFKRLFNNKKFLILLSVILAFILWIVNTINQTPTIDRTFADMQVTINMSNTIAEENKLNIIGDITEQKFTVAVRGPNYIVGALKPSEISLYASAAAVDSPGEYELEVAANKLSSGSEYEVLSISPAKVKVYFDYVDTREFTIEAVAEGVTAVEGLIAESAVVSGTESNTVTIKGPRTVINSIEKVVAKTVANKTLSASETFEASILLFDAENKQIDTKNLTLSTTNVKVTVPISKKKEVPVNADFSNVPSGFNKSSIKHTVDHAKVTIIGTPETVDKTTQITLSAIDLKSLTKSSKSFDVSAKLPEGVRLLDTIENFVVTVDMSDYSEKTVTVSRIKYNGLASGLTTSKIQSIKNVKICGPRSIINRFDQSKAYAEIDLTNKVAGEHTVSVSISFDGYTNVWAIGNYSTTVTVK